MRRTSIHRSSRARLRVPAVVAVVGAIAVLGAAPGARAAGTQVSVFPIPNDRVATEHTQIVIRGVPASRFGTITVTGAATGRHSGKVEADSDGDGGSFIPDRPFAANELVTVSTGLHVIGASGGGGTWHFRIETPARNVSSRPLPTFSRVKGDVWNYRTTTMRPASVKVVTRPRGIADGDLFIAPQSGPAQNGVEMLNRDGQLVWFRTVPRGDTATDFRVQTYQKRPVLTWWQGEITTSGTGRGEDEIYNGSYKHVATIHAGNGLASDLHEFQLTSADTALVTAYQPVIWNASKIKTGSKREIVYDAVAQEIDIKTGLVLFQWDSLDHIALGDSYAPVAHARGVPWDYFHINSIQLLANGALLISARNTSSVYLVNGQTGKVEWILGGKRSKFALGKGVRFWYQHDARIQPDGALTLFDDAGAPFREPHSRGLTIHLTYGKHMTASLTQQLSDTPPVRGPAEGSEQPLSNGDNLVGWGQGNNITEFNPEGKVVFDARFTGVNASYRAYRFPWTGNPAIKPAIASHTYRGQTSVSASWNGSTRTHRWRILGGSSPKKLRTVATDLRTRYETTMQLHRLEAYVQVQSLDARGKVLGTSKVIKGA